VLADIYILNLFNNSKAEMADADVTSAEDPPTCSVTGEGWVVPTGQKKRKPIDKSADEKAHVVYITGTKKNVVKLNPLSVYVRRSVQ